MGGTVSLSEGLNASLRQSRKTVEAMRISLKCLTDVEEVRNFMLRKYAILCRMAITVYLVRIV
jgi:hypothetical protein